MRWPNGLLGLWACLWQVPKGCEISLSIIQKSQRLLAPPVYEEKNAQEAFQRWVSVELVSDQTIPFCGGPRSMIDELTVLDAAPPTEDLRAWLTFVTKLTPLSATSSRPERYNSHKKPKHNPMEPYSMVALTHSPSSVTRQTSG